MEITKEMLNAPAFGEGSANPLGETQPSEKIPADTSHVEREEKGTSEPTPEEDGGEQKVPYSRFKKNLDARIEAERAAQDAEDRYQDLLRQRDQERYQPVSQETQSQNYKGNLPNYWVKLYGDSEVSREAYGYELERQSAIEERAEQRALESLRNERDTETRAVMENEGVIDNRIEDLSAQLGRDLSEKEELSLLDIVDEYTPKDRDGNYAGDTIPFEKAWEIYEMKQLQQSSSSRRSRSAAAAATSSRTDGEPHGNEKSNKDFDPRNWNAYKQRL